MLAAKERDGSIWVAQLEKAMSPEQPGLFNRAWVRVGPGKNPVVTLLPGTTTYLLAFDYLGNIYARELDVSVWPPIIVDPVTYTPFISIQSPCEALSYELSSSVGRGRIYSNLDKASSLKRSGDALIHWDMATGIFSAQVSRDTSTNPNYSTRTGWRVYWRRIGETAWTLLQDWVTEVTDLPVSDVGSLRVELVLSYGHLWHAESRNQDIPVTKDYIESDLGDILRIDSDLESKAFGITVQDQHHISYRSDGSVSSGIFDERLRFYVLVALDEFQVRCRDTNVASFTPTGKSPFVVPPDPQDQIPVPRSSGNLSSLVLSS